VASTVPELETLREVLRRHLPDGRYRAFLFGSRAAGTAASNADWDIGIEGPSELPGHVLQHIAEELEELPTLHRFDVVDMKTVSESFRESAMRHTVPL
jgi:predicted nucleotidyltransferase